MTCRTCGAEIYKWSSRKVYCGSECSRAFHNNNRVDSVLSRKTAAQPGSLTACNQCGVECGTLKALLEHKAGHRETYSEERSILRSTATWNDTGRTRQSGW